MLNLTSCAPHSTLIICGLADCCYSAEQKYIMSVRNIKTKSVKKKKSVKIIPNNNSLSLDEQNYLRTILYPEQFSFRPTDIVSQPTTLYRSVREFSLIANLDGTIDSGRFSFAVQPKLGGVDELNHFQVAIVDNSGGWPANSQFSLSNTYVSSNLGVDPRVDPNVPTLTYPPIGNLALDSIVYSGDLAHFNASGPFTVITGSQFNTSPNFVTLPGDLTLANGVQVFARTYYNQALWLPCGSYAISQYSENQGTFTGTLSYSCGFLITNKAGTIVLGAWYRGPSGNYAYGVVNDTSVVQINHDHSGALHNANQGLLNVVQIVLNFDDDMLYVPIFLGPTIAGDQCALRLTINPSIVQPQDTASSCGNVSKLRPVAMSCLLTNTIAELVAGGDVVAYSAPAGVISKDYFQSNNTMGAYQRWEDLARNNKGILTYDGKYKDGAYLFYQPYDTSDILLRDPIEANDYAYPGLIVSGQFNSSSGMTGLIEVGRIRIIILFEYITDNPLFSAESQFGSTNSVEKLFSCVSMMPHAMENKLHMKTIADMVKKAANFTIQNADKIQKTVTLATGIAKLLV